MKKVFFITGILFSSILSFCQTTTNKLQKAFAEFESDSQLKHAISSLYVIDGKTGEIVFDKNSRIGLAGASTQKIITSTSVYEILGRNYGYRTLFFLDGPVTGKSLNGNFIIRGSGDPTFGSWRYEATKRTGILESIVTMLKNQGIEHIKGDIVIDNSSFETNPVPGGWTWDDIGNYYGAGAYGFNWNENQYDLVMNGGKKPGDAVEIAGTEPVLQSELINELSSGPENSGDNGYIYLAPYSEKGFVRGTIPAGAKNFKISGSMADPARQFYTELKKALADAKITIKGELLLSPSMDIKPKIYPYNLDPFNFLISPSIDSIIYWFLKKSINLYGEALLKTLAYEKRGFGATDTGINVIRELWKDKGIGEDELNLLDGSGLSPSNRLTTHAQTTILQYAKTRDWFPFFYNALPEYNDMKMKSGTIRDVKGFCGYQNAKDGHEYIFSFLVNNYNGSSAALVKKMYKVLDNLK
ncbi:MAG TPA: D-alanyl-D-alanine carboxypeptidase/D-alanyl-D-alanine-endopeptidase [Chitinophagaceae bacterium]|nr:D-alanyl-D-alanine carboxypeptidase/D-alanyl-D-alanine-endopeptidase [Chitinophagaceae bacterium]